MTGEDNDGCVDVSGSRLDRSARDLPITLEFAQTLSGQSLDRERQTKCLSSNSMRKGDGFRGKPNAPGLHDHHRKRIKHPVQRRDSTCRSGSQTSSQQPAALEREHSIMIVRYWL